MEIVEKCNSNANKYLANLLEQQGQNTANSSI